MDALDLSALKDKSPSWVKAGADRVTRTYALGSVGQRPAPDFLVIGTKRGGTTSLYNYLLQHPGVLGLFPQSRGKKSTDYFFKEWDRGDKWYRSHFHTELHRERMRRRLGYRPVGGEASPYYMWDPRIAPRVRGLTSGVRAIALVRDPVERAWSHYQERVQNGVEPLGFVDALRAEEGRLEGEPERMAADSSYYSPAWDFYPYRSRGVYQHQLESWAEVFGRENLLVVRSEDMYTDVQKVFSLVCAFLGIPPWEVPRSGTFNARHRSSAMPEEARRELEAYFAPHNRRLEEWLGHHLKWSS